MKDARPWILIDQCLEKKVGVTLLYVLESIGSSPGRQGFYMAVAADGSMEGSIGGGIMEHKFVEMAKSSLQSTVGSRQSEHAIKKQVHDKTAAKNQSGMICSGEQTILLYTVKENDHPTISNIIASLEQNKNGTLTLSPAGIAFSETAAERDFYYAFQSEDDWLYKEKTGYKNQLTIIGGGHCALAFTKLMHSMDLYIRVYDERKDLKTMVENDAAHEKHFIRDYAELSELIQPGNDHYVVIMTFGYRTDDTALMALVGKEFKYIGLLGSKFKVQKMLDDYRKQQINEEWLQ